MKIEERYKKFIDYFSKHNPQAKTELNYTNNYELMIAVILSAQCTDKRVNQITPKLFERFPDLKTLSKACEKEIFALIRSCSYPNNKTKNILALSKKLISEYNGEIPSDIDELQKLPGIGRKTANVILAVAFNQQAFPVDTHVFRVSERIGLTKNSKSPLETEKIVTKYLPKDLFSLAHHWLILHGRYTCTARKPKCIECGLNDFCSYYKKIKDI